MVYPLSGCAFRLFLFNMKTVKNSYRRSGITRFWQGLVPVTQSFAVLRMITGPPGRLDVALRPRWFCFPVDVLQTYLQFYCLCPREVYSCLQWFVNVQRCTYISYHCMASFYLVAANIWYCNVRTHSCLCRPVTMTTIIYYLSQHGLRPLWLTIVFKAVILCIPDTSALARWQYCRQCDVMND